MGDRVAVEVGIARGQRTQNLCDTPLQSLVEHQLAPLEGPNYLGRQIVGGRPEAAACQDHIDSLSGHELEGRSHVGRPVAHDRDVRQIDARLEQSVGQPRAVAVAHAPRQDLGAGYNDAGARGVLAHPHEGCCEAVSVWRPALVTA